MTSKGLLAVLCRAFLVPLPFVPFGLMLAGVRNANAVSRSVRGVQVGAHLDNVGVIFPLHGFRNDGGDFVKSYAGDVGLALRANSAVDVGYSYGLARLRLRSGEFLDESDEEKVDFEFHTIRGRYLLPLSDRRTRFDVLMGAGWARARYWFKHTPDIFDQLFSGERSEVFTLFDRGHQVQAGVGAEVEAKLGFRVSVAARYVLVFTRPENMGFLGVGIGVSYLSPYWRDPDSVAESLRLR